MLFQVVLDLLYIVLKFWYRKANHDVWEVSTFFLTLEILEEQIYVWT